MSCHVQHCTECKNGRLDTRGEDRRYFICLGEFKRLRPKSIPFKQLKFNKNINNNKSHFPFTKGPVLKCNLDCSSKCTLMEILFQQISIPCTICNISHNFISREMREQKNEQQNNAPSAKKQCSCRLSGSSENRHLEKVHAYCLSWF